MMKKKTWLMAEMAVLAAGLAGAALAGCSGGKKQFEDYAYNYGGVDQKNWRALEYPDQDMVMDGLVDEESYGSGYLSFSDVNDVNMKVYAHMGEEGVFFGFVSNDRYVNYNPRNDVFNNTSVEIQVAPADTESLNCNVVQLRLGANGTPDQWVGFPADDLQYSYTKKYVPSMGVVHIDGTLNGSADGYSVELYLPYSSIGLSEKPEEIICAPSFNTLPDPLNSQRATWTMMLGCNLSRPETWYVINEDGMTSHTAGFTDGDYVRQIGEGEEFYYFDSEPQSAYYLKSKVSAFAGQNSFFNDDYPKFGLVNKSDHALQSFHIDAAHKTGTNFGTVHAEQSTNAGTNWMWDTNASTSMGQHWGSEIIGNYKNVDMEVIYYGGDLYFVLDGTLVKTVRGFAPEEEGAIPGFMCFNTMAEFSSNEYETDAEKVKTEAEKFIAKDRTIDGDLSDWAEDEAGNQAINRHAKKVENDNGNSMEVRAFRGQDGLYIAYNVHHIVNLPPFKWDDGWWNNTNIEFYVNGTVEKNHYALTTFGTSGYMDAVMTTTRDEDRTYTTVAEIFVPFASLERDGYDKATDLEVGFAFKSANNTADANLNGTDWWAIEGTPTSKQFAVHEAGIGEEYTLTYTAGEGTGDDVTVKVFGGDTVQLAENIFRRDGYKFVAWSYGQELYGAGENFVMPEADATLTAEWIVNSATGSFRVTYNKGDAAEITGTAPQDSKTYAPGEQFEVAGQGDLAYEGYRFMGWQNADGSIFYRAGKKAFMGEGDLVLTAVWSKEYTLTYSLGDYEGKAPEGRTYVEGESVVVTTEFPPRDGFDVYGWSDGDKVYFPGEKFNMPAENVTLTVVWKRQLNVDGDLSDWEELGSETIGAHTPELDDDRAATWYGIVSGDGLYLAAEITHRNAPVAGNENWWLNTNFEIQFASEQYYAYLSGGTAPDFTVGTSSQAGVVAAYRYVAGEEGALHRSMFEVFIPLSLISGEMRSDGSVRVGLALKSDGGTEQFTGGGNNGGPDAWYSAYGAPTAKENADCYPYVTRDGIYLKDEYEHPEWTFGTAGAIADDNSIHVDGVIDDWAGIKSLDIVGSGAAYEGKSAKFYGKMTQNGLYVAVDAYHKIFTGGQGNWFDNTNFELRIGEKCVNILPKQYYAYAAKDDKNTYAASDAYMQVAGKTVEVSDPTSNKVYHTVIEIFIPAASLDDYMVRNGMIHVGMAFKTVGDEVNNVGEWWRPAGTDIRNEIMLLGCVDGTGNYTQAEYSAKQS